MMKIMIKYCGKREEIRMSVIYFKKEHERRGNIHLCGQHHHLHLLHHHYHQPFFTLQFHPWIILVSSGCKLILSVCCNGKPQQSSWLTQVWMRCCLHIQHFLLSQDLIYKSSVVSQRRNIICAVILREVGYWSIEKAGVSDGTVGISVYML